MVSGSTAYKKTTLTVHVRTTDLCSPSYLYITWYLTWYIVFAISQRYITRNVTKGHLYVGKVTIRVRREIHFGKIIILARY